jgi:hypothetical protein
MARTSMMNAPDRIVRGAERVLRILHEAETNGMGGSLFCDLPEVDATTSTGRMNLERWPRSPSSRGAASVSEPVRPSPQQGPVA